MFGLDKVIGGITDIAKDVMNIAGDLAPLAMTAAFPQLAIANALGGLMQSAVTGAVGGAVDQLCKEGQLPKFIGNMIKEAISQLVPGQGGCDPCSTQVEDKVGGKFADFAKDLMSDIVDSFKKYKCDAEKGQGPGGGDKAGGGGKSWFVALMQALGEVQNKQAAKVEKLAGEVSDVLGAGDDSNGSKQAQFDKMEEFKAEAKLQEVFANITKSVGDAIGNSIATVARAQ